MYSTPASRVGRNRFSPCQASSRSSTPRRYVRSVWRLTRAPLEPCKNRYASVSAHSSSASRALAALAARRRRSSGASPAQDSARASVSPWNRSRAVPFEVRAPVMPHATVGRIRRVIRLFTPFERSMNRPGLVRPSGPAPYGTFWPYRPASLESPGVAVDVGSPVARSVKASGRPLRVAASVAPWNAPYTGSARTLRADASNERALPGGTSRVRRRGTGLLSIGTEHGHLSHRTRTLELGSARRGAARHGTATA